MDKAASTAASSGQAFAQAGAAIRAALADSGRAVARSRGAGPPSGSMAHPDGYSDRNGEGEGEGEGELLVCESSFVNFLDSLEAELGGGMKRAP